jgi:hypothetical protein
VDFRRDGGADAAAGTIRNGGAWAAAGDLRFTPQLAGGNGSRAEDGGNDSCEQRGLGNLSQHNSNLPVRGLDDFRERQERSCWRPKAV